jgi:hypothetical protein
MIKLLLMNFNLATNRMVGSRDNVVGMAAGHGLHDRGVGGREFSLFYAVQASSGVNLNSYPMGTGGSFPGGKRAEELS